MEYVDLGLPSGKKWAKCNLGLILKKNMVCIINREILLDIVNNKLMKENHLITRIINSLM